MAQFTSPILLHGDSYTCKNAIVSAKSKYPEYRWIVLSATSDSLDKIRADVETYTLDDTSKAVVIQEIPNKKAIRDFLLDLASSLPDFTKLIIWDSENHIKRDPKTKEIDKTWQDFITTFGKIKNSKIINGGDEFTEKNIDECINFIIKLFQKHNKKISSSSAKLLISIVGYNRGMLDSDINKMCLISPEEITSDFILDNAFPSSKEAILYKISNVLDTGTYEDSVNMTEQFLANGINGNVIAEIFVKKARWQMAAAYYWSEGVPWYDITNKLMNMGKFPSAIWHNEEMNEMDKRAEAEKYQSSEGIAGFLNVKQGIPIRYLKIDIDEKKKAKGAMVRKGAEIIPMPFMADQYVDFIRNKIVGPNSNIPEQELKKKVLDRAIKVYLFTQKKLAEIRYLGYKENSSQHLQEMVKALTDCRLGI